MCVCRWLGGYMTCLEMIVWYCGTECHHLTSVSVPMFVQSTPMDPMLIDLLNHIVVPIDDVDSDFVWDTVSV